MNICAYDLLNNREKIDCELKSSEGLIKNVFVPFDKQLKVKDKFDIEITRTANNSMVYGLDYIYYRIPFKYSLKNKNTKRVLTLEFPMLEAPNSVRMYSVNSRNKVKRIGMMKKTINKDIVSFTDENFISTDDTLIVFFNREHR